MPSFDRVDLSNRAKLLAITLIGVAGAASIAVVSRDSRSPSVGTAAARFVAVTQMVENSALDAVRNGIRDELAAAGYEEGKTLRWEWLSAKGSPVAAVRIADKYAEAKPDVIVAIAPYSAKTVSAATRTTPIVFSAVADPIESKLVRNIRRPGGNISGVENSPPIRQQIELIREVLPNIETLGVIYSANEGDAVSSILQIKDNATELDIAVEDRLVLLPVDVIEAARSLVGSVDAIYIPTDKTVNSALEGIIQVGQDNQIPVFAGDTEAVKKGAIATVSFDYYDLGRQTGEMVIEVLRGNRPGDLAVESAKGLKLSVNVEAAESMGVKLPGTVMLRAGKNL